MSKKDVDGRKKKYSEWGIRLFRKVERQSLMEMKPYGKSCVFLRAQQCFFSVSEMTALQKNVKCGLMSVKSVLTAFPFPCTDSKISHKEGLVLTLTRSSQWRRHVRTLERTHCIYSQHVDAD